MQIKVNGEAVEVPEGMTIAALLEQRGLSPRYLAVERNLELVPRQQHVECILQAGDQLEIVTLVGGG
ncbi:MAG: sulfur carrier protein ThiS [Planctomycetaceae bacterium]|nr:sulfur carrier protein ThiS [Planctomycetaceae bacterium]